MERTKVQEQLILELEKKTLQDEYVSIFNMVNRKVAERFKHYNDKVMELHIKRCSGIELTHEEEVTQRIACYVCDRIGKIFIDKGN